MISIIDAMTGEECFGRWFQGESWDAWKAILKAAFALPLTPQELVTFGELAGGRSPPARRVRELWVAAGRRAGKDSIASLAATFAAAIEQAHLGRLRPGELAVVQCLAVGRDQARLCYSTLIWMETLVTIGTIERAKIRAATPAEPPPRVAAVVYPQPVARIEARAALMVDPDATLPS
jgi:hypothetical protein